ncbi:hypothetical protein [Streptomyces sp. NPDC048172]|uniref:hypothetical protein n=1 Tax=Streptomyces sp. NPDC048172 TaxID=3365505 RepID=UPI0037121985
MRGDTAGGTSGDPEAAGTPREGDAAPTQEDPRAELERLRAEVAELRARTGTGTGTGTETGKRRRAQLSGLRRALAAVLVALVAVCTLASVVGVWGARTTLNTDRWVATVGPLPADPDVNAAVSRRLTNQLFVSLDVRERLEDALPPRARFLAAPVTDSVRDYMRARISKMLKSDTFEGLWTGANRLAHARLVALLEGKAKNVQVKGSTVTLNLLPMANNAIAALEPELPQLFGKKLDLPTLTSGELPPGLHERIEKALGVSLPENFGQITLYDRDELRQLQLAVLVFKRGLVGLVIGTFVLLGLALWASPARRRTLLQLGLWLVVCVTVLTSVLRAVRDQLLGQVPEGVYRDGLRAAMWHVFATLRERGDQLLWFGIVLAVLAYVVGPGRLPVAARGGVRRAARATGTRVATAAHGLPARTAVRAWTRRHADVLRIAGLAVAALCALLLSSWTGLLVVAVLLAAYEIAVTLLARGSPAQGEVAEPAPGRP